MIKVFEFSTCLNEMSERKAISSEQQRQQLQPSSANNQQHSIKM